ncbi:nitrilase-related carbon-nitrogen hydrolase [Desulfurivibrio dismutans]|uniref:nitrilase-related carbon-nitrogen hydrolase n=1 Tax=Desulfurivibrio dismutans TaxID=1398908 RepID=UPI0023D97A98|nr:nitrilase-related carbon-nitrogen hydrolase [Desulfurivibrio alkaliphilus]MDF1614235.1 nitrilase [Desulfurivibrio alkaliphilus]
MQVTICQTNPRLFAVEQNLEQVIERIAHHRARGAELIIFPELALTGYFVGARYHEMALRLDSPQIKRLAAATKGTAAVVGFIEESRSMNFYNAALVAVDGEILFCYRKINLPNYGVFEEKKFFSGGKRVPVFRLGEFNVAVFICNDLWHPSLPYLGIAQKADIFVTIFNSSQGSMGSEFCNIESWQIINKFYARIFGIYNLCANRVGEEGPENRREIDYSEEAVADAPGSFNFWGGSEIINPFGQEVVRARLHEMDEVGAVIDREMLRQKRIILPYLRNDDPHFTQRELERILQGDKQYVTRRELRKVVRGEKY